MRRLHTAVLKTSLLMVITIPTIITNAQMVHLPVVHRMANNAAVADTATRTLVSFTAQQVNDKIQLTWSASQDINISQYSIERSYDNTNFDLAAIVFTSDEPVAVNNYAFKDAIRQKTGAQVYYRLKLIDKQGAYTYSDIKNIVRAKL